LEKEPPSVNVGRGLAPAVASSKLRCPKDRKCGFCIGFYQEDVVVFRREQAPALRWRMITGHLNSDLGSCFY